MVDSDKELQRRKENREFFNNIIEPALESLPPGPRKRAIKFFIHRMIGLLQKDQLYEIMNELQYEITYKIIERS